MKRTVKMSTYSMVMSIIGIMIMAGMYFYVLRNGQIWLAYVIAAMVLVICGGVLIYMPMSISVDDKALHINRSLMQKTIPLADIKSIELIQPTMAERLIIGSRGWFGYWGRFSEATLGRYFAYYGKASDCFLVVLKDGRRYMLGCDDPASVVDYVKARIA